MKISSGPLLFQQMKSEFEDTRQHSRTTICKYDQLHMQYDLQVYGCLQLHMLKDEV